MAQALRQIVSPGFLRLAKLSDQRVTAIGTYSHRNLRHRSPCHPCNLYNLRHRRSLFRL